MTNHSETGGIEIRTLRALSPEDIRQLNVGYTSTAVYRAHKSETPGRMVIKLELAELEQPL